MDKRHAKQFRFTSNLPKDGSSLLFYVAGEVSPYAAMFKTWLPFHGSHVLNIRRYPLCVGACPRNAPKPGMTPTDTLTTYTDMASSENDYHKKSALRRFFFSYVLSV
jgi:hypothetical protein